MFRRFLPILTILALLFLQVAVHAQANKQITFTYVGNNFTSIGGEGPVTTSNHITASITLNVKGNSVNYPSDGSTLVAWSMSDGVHSESNTSSNASSFALNSFAANSSNGWNVSSWNLHLNATIAASTGPDYLTLTSYYNVPFTFGGLDKSYLQEIGTRLGYEDASSYSPGTWLATVGPPPTYNIFVGGFFDNVHKPVQDYYNKYKSKFSNPSYYPYDNESEIEQYIKGLPSNATINLIGHSYGGDTAALAAVHCGRKINILVTVDPVSAFGVNSLFGPNYATVASHATTWIDINATGSGNGNFYAGIGSPWNKGPEKFATYYEDPDDAHAEFTSMMQYKSSVLGNKSAEQVLLGN